MNPLATIRHHFREALSQLVDDPEELVDMVRSSQDPKFGDYQVNCAMPLGKRLKRPPRQIAEEILGKLDISEICQDPEVAGPGFINLRLRDAWIEQALLAASRDDRLGIPPAKHSRTFVIDYSAPNVAKPMHVGHVRSTVIGDSLCRVLRFLGHRVISDNHIGDWGTQFGMIIHGWKHFRDEAAYRQDPVKELARLYRLVQALASYEEKVSQSARLEQSLASGKDDDEEAEKRKQAQLREWNGQLAAARENELLGPLVDAGKHEGIGEAALRETARLHAGDEENRRLWEEFLPPCREEMESIYRRLDVSFDETLGESFYHDQLAGVVEALQARGLATESDGALCVFLEGHQTPFIVRKRDGAYLYATTDLATLQYRLETWQPDEMLYVVDHRQSLHFEQLFATARQWFPEADLELRHISFGTVLGEDGRPFKTRSGDTVGLHALLDEAVARARGVLESSGEQDRPEEFLQQIAESVGIGALKYADLSQNRTSDYTFSYDKMLAMQGNTATYMQYAYARVRSIFSKGNIDEEQFRQAVSTPKITAPEERALALEILRFPEALEAVVADYRPNLLTNYLFTLAESYSRFFEHCPVLKAPEESVRDTRLLLCDLTARVLKQGLSLLGINVVERM